MPSQHAAVTYRRHMRGTLAVQALYNAVLNLAQNTVALFLSSGISMVLFLRPCLFGPVSRISSYREEYSVQCGLRSSLS